MEPRTCLIPGCDREKIEVRGICLAHYRVAREKVDGGETTWEELEAMGLAFKDSNKGKGFRQVQFERAFEQAKKNNGTDK